MIFFGHLGITTAAVKVYENTVKNKMGKRKAPLIDYRMVFIGAILPDLIDKPIGAFFFRGFFHNSRIIAHTLLFSLLLIAVGSYYLRKEKNNKVLLFGIGSFIHLVLDKMWLYKGTALWPLYGLKFPERPEGNWVESSFAKLMTDPYLYGAEIVGMIIIGYYLVKTIKNKKGLDFLKDGTLL